MVERKKTNRAKARKGVSALLSLSLLVLADETPSIVHLGQALVCCYYIPHMHGDFLSLYPGQHYSVSLVIWPICIESPEGYAVQIINSKGDSQPGET